MTREITALIDEEEDRLAFIRGVRSPLTNAAAESFRCGRPLRCRAFTVRIPEDGFRIDVDPFENENWEDIALLERMPPCPWLQVGDRTLSFSIVYENSINFSFCYQIRKWSISSLQLAEVFFNY